MEIIYFILPLALIFAGGSVWAFFWAAKRGQFDDLDTPPFRVLMDDETTRVPRAETPEQTDDATSSPDDEPRRPSP